MKSCPHCNRPFPPEVQVGGIIRQRIFDYVKAHPAGVSTRQIMDSVWYDDFNGGPSSPDVVAVNVWHINRKLQERGHALRVSADRFAGNVYKVIHV